MNHMPCSVTDQLTPDDIPEHEDEEVRDALTQDDSLRNLQREILMDIGRSVDQLKDLPFARKQG